MAECFVAKASEMQAGKAEIGAFYKDGAYFAYSNYCLHSGGPAGATSWAAPRPSCSGSTPSR